MPMRRRYETYELREMLRNAEGVASPVTGQGAHSRGLHAMRTPGGVGVNKDEMMDRTHKREVSPGVFESNNQFKKRGAGRTSTFNNLVQQADAACQALNSVKGQAALTHMDSPVLADKDLRVTLEVGPILETGFLPGTASPKMHTVAKSDVAVNTIGAGSPGAAGVRLIFDRAAHGTSIHIQTCFPLDSLAVSSFKVRDMVAKVDLHQG